ncbi:MAG: chromosomal replication initiator protein DnaA [Deltaproteobacteria bacterium]|nr:chromosomal replication initiator protein DnaA [Deltaproteobacteria bacterium]
MEMSAQDIHRLWEQAAERVRQRAPASFDMWFAGVQFDGLHQGKFRLGARDEFVRDFVREHYEHALLEELTTLLHSQPDLEWVIRADLDHPVSSTPAAKPVVPRSIRIIHAVGPDPVPDAAPTRAPALCEVAPLLGVNPKNTFVNFVVGPSNQLAFAASVAASGGGGRRYNPLFLCGSTGLGKTHLLHAIAHRIHSERPSARIVYGSADSFTNEYIAALTVRRMDEFRARYHHCDALLIDDVQSLAGRTQTQEEFFNTFNILHAQDKQIVIAADKYPQQLDRMEERLVSRFTWGLVADVQTPELETRVAIIRKKAMLENVELSEDLAVLLAQTVQSNVRELEGMLIRLIAKSSLMRCQLDMDFARAELALAMPSRPQVTTVEHIQNAVCTHFHVNATEMLSHVRHRSVSKARHIAMYLCRQRLQCSFPEIGRAFNGRDHTTVMSAVRKVEAQREKDPEIRAHIEAIERKLSTGD